VPMSENDELKAFYEQNREDIDLISNDFELKECTRKWISNANKKRYSYHFEWMGRPIIQYPQDIVAMQEIIWEVKPDLIIETGIAHGGSLVLSASMLSLLDLCELKEGEKLSLKDSKRMVLGVDIDIREYNRMKIEKHPMSHRIKMLQGSSIDSDVIQQVKGYAEKFQRILIFLDSNHTHDHVLEELRAYAPLTSIGSYCVVFDTAVEDLPEDFFNDRPWGKGDNPKTAVWEYLETLKNDSRKGTDGKPLNFEIDKLIENRLLITVAPDGYLKRI